MDEVNPQIERISGSFVYWAFTSYIKVDNDLIKCNKDHPAIEKTLREIIEPHIIKIRDFCKFYAMQIEECPTTGRCHMQAYIHLKKKGGLAKTITLFDDEFWNHPRFDPCKSRHENNLTYCTKEETRLLGPWVWPSNYKAKGKQGKRSDLDQVIELIDEGMNLTDIARLHPNTTLRYNRHLDWYQRQSDRIHNRNVVHYNARMEIHAIIGPAGCGKTRYVIENNPDVYQLTRTGQNVWFDGYIGQDTLLIDDFNGWIPHKMFLKIIDKYTNIILPVKGSSTIAKWTKVYITSNTPPDDWYEYKYNADKQAVLRRIDTITNHYPANHVSPLDSEW